MKKSLTLVLSLGLSLVVPATAKAADDYPARPVTLVVPTGAAGGTDTIARYVGEQLSRRLHQTFIVDNRPGANGMLGAEMVAHAPPDGYRLLFTYAAGLVVNPSLYRKVPYDIGRDFAPIAQIGRGGNVMLVNNNLPVKDIKDFVAYAKARPGKLNYCSWGNGSGGHLTMESLKRQAGLDMAHVPYKGSAACVQDILGGQVEAGWADSSTTVELVRSGKVRALLTSAAQRLRSMPNVPTMNEAGYRFDTYSWYGLLAPAGTPKTIVAKLNGAVREMLADPAVIERFRQFNFEDLPLTTPEEFATVIRQDTDAWGQLVRSLRIQLD